MDLTSRIANLSPAKRALLELAINAQESNDKSNAGAIIPRQQQRATAPLSFAQQRLWFLDQLHPGKADYNLPHLLHMAGSLNIAALRNARWNKRMRSRCEINLISPFFERNAIFGWQR